MLPTPMATPEEANRIKDVMLNTSDPRRGGRAMTRIINDIDLPYNNRERAYQILRIGATYTIRNPKLLSWAQFQTHVNRLLECVSPRGTTGLQRHKRLKATRKVIRAFRTVTGVRLVRPGDVDAITQETRPLVVTARSRPLSRVGQPPLKLIYGDQPPMEYTARQKHLKEASIRKEKRAARRQGDGDTPSAQDVTAAEQKRHGDLWKYHATNKFLGLVRSSRRRSRRKLWHYDTIELSAVATPDNATSLWAALS